MLLDPSKLCPQIERDVCKVVAVVALPDREAVIVDGSFSVTLPEPFTDTPAPALLPLELAM